MKKVFIYIFIFNFFILDLFLNYDFAIANRRQKKFFNQRIVNSSIAAATLKMKPKEELPQEKKIETTEPTKEQYNKYYQFLNDLNTCVFQACSGSGSKIPSNCFNVISSDQKIRHNCSIQLNAIKSIHPKFELDAIIDVKTKLLDASKKACEGLSGTYSGGTPPNKYSGDFMSFGTCSIKVGYSPEQLNKGEVYSVRNIRRMDIGASRLCSMETFGVSSIDMISDGNEKGAIDIEVQSNAALLSLGIDITASFAKQQIAKSFIKKNGKCICTNPINGNTCSVKSRFKTEIGKELTRRGEAVALTTDECEEYSIYGYNWVDNIDAEINKAKNQYNESQKLLVSECVIKGSNSRYKAEPYLGKIDELSNEIKQNLNLEKNMIIGDTSIIYTTTDNKPTMFGDINQKVLNENGAEVSVFQGSPEKDGNFKIISGVRYGINSGKLLKKREIFDSVDSSMEKEECLCNIDNKDFSHYDLWDNNTIMCYYNDNSFMNIRIVKQGRNFEKGIYIEAQKKPNGYTSVSSDTRTKYNWQIGAIEQAEGAYSKAMLTQYMTNVAIKTNMRNLAQNVKAINKDKQSYASPSDISNALNSGGGTDSSFQNLQNTIGNINSLQQMQTDANKKYNTAVANYESIESNIKEKGDKLSGLQDEKTEITNMASGRATFVNLLNNKDTVQTLSTLVEAGSKKEEAIEATKEIRTGFCYIVTKDNKIGQVIARENEPFKINYDLLYKK